MLWWWHKLPQRRTRGLRQDRSVRSPLRLQLELLEDRLVPSTASSLVSSAVGPVAHTDHTVVHSHGSTSPAASTGPVGLKPSQIRQAYGIDQIVFSGGTVQGNGAGQTIAIIDAYDDPSIAHDLS